MSNDTKVTLKELSDEQFDSTINKTLDKMTKAAKGKIVIKREKYFLEKIKKPLQKLVEMGYSYAEIANLIRDEESGVLFTAKQLRDFCNEKGFSKQQKNFVKAQKNKTGLNKDIDSEVTTQNDVIPTGNRKRPKGEA